MNEVRSQTIRRGRDAKTGLDTRRLMRAVLLEALVSYQRGLTARSAEHRVEACRIEAWAASTDCDSPFSFENVCSVLGIDPDYIRSRLRRFRRKTHERQAGPRRARRIRRSAYGA